MSYGAGVHLRLPIRTVAAAVTVSALLVACSDDGTPAAVTTVAPVPDTVDVTADERLAEELAQRGGGRAELRIGDETWAFEPVLCTPGDDVGLEGAVLTVVGLDDGLQLTVDLNEQGSTVSLEDVERFEDPRASWQATEGADGDVVAYELGGDTVEVTTDGFRDNLDDESPAVPGSVSVTCG